MSKSPSFVSKNDNRDDGDNDNGNVFHRGAKAAKANVRPNDNLNATLLVNAERRSTPPPFVVTYRWIVRYGMM